MCLCVFDVALCLYKYVTILKRVHLPVHVYMSLYAYVPVCMCTYVYARMYVYVLRHNYPHFSWNMVSTRIFWTPWKNERRSLTPLILKRSRLLRKPQEFLGVSWPLLYSRSPGKVERAKYINRKLKEATKGWHRNVMIIKQWRWWLSDNDDGNDWWWEYF